MFDRVSNFLGGAVDFIGDAGGKVLDGLQSTADIVTAIPGNIVEAGYDIEEDFYHDGSTQPPQYTQPPQEEDRTALYIAGGVGLLLVVVLLTQN